MTQNEQTDIPLDLIKQGVNNMGIARLLGMRIEALEDGIGRVSIRVDERLMHPQQIVHGGVIFTLADTAMSMALLSVIAPGTRFSTIEAKINFLAPVRTGELRAEASIVQQGRSIAVLEATVYNLYDDVRTAVARIVPKNLAFDDTGFMELPAGLARSSSSLIGDHTLGCCSSSKLCGSALRVSEN